MRTSIIKVYFNYHIVVLSSENMKVTLKIQFLNICYFEEELRLDCEYIIMEN